MEGNVKWIILSDSLDKPPHFGGPMILHYISKILLEIGEVVYMNHPFYQGAKQLNIEIANSLDPKNTILIVSENDFRLEEFNFKTVRLLLNFGKNIEKYKDTELIFQYGKSFTLGTKLENSDSIKPIIINLDFWKNLQCERSDKPLILIKKGKIKKETDLVQGIRLDNIINSEITRQTIDFELLKYFNTHKTFITYDNETFYSIQAALCGAISIVIPDGRLTEDEWRNSNPIRKWGIAYGNNQNQIDFAMSTIDEFKKTIDEMSIKSKDEIVYFIEKTLSFFNLK